MCAKDLNQLLLLLMQQIGVKLIKYSGPYVTSMFGKCDPSLYFNHY